MFEPPQITIRLVHPAIHSAVSNVQVPSDQIKITAAILSLPYGTERLAIKVAEPEPFGEEVGATGVDIAGRHNVGPEHWS